MKMYPSVAVMPVNLSYSDRDTVSNGIAGVIQRWGTSYPCYIAFELSYLCGP